MKKLAEKSVKRLAYRIIALTFLVSNSISYRINDKAQSDFAKNSLSFLLMKEEDADFIDTLEKFNNNHKNLSLVYLTDKNEVLYNPDNINTSNFKIKNFKSEDVGSSKKFFRASEDQEVYGAKAKNVLLIANKNDIWFYINIYLLLFYIALAFLINIIVSRYVDKKVDEYLKKINFDNYSNILRDNNYDEISHYLKGYVDEIEKAGKERNELKARLLEFTNITSNMKEGFILFDGDGNVELMNASAQNYLGVKKDAHISNLIDNKEYSLALREASILKRSKNLDIRINGYYLRVFIDPLSTSDKKAYAMIIVDNSEDVRAEQMRREFSANVTHELKSPLTSINGYAELIATGIAKQDDVVKFAEIIYKEGNRLLEIIDDILKISRLDENNFDKNYIEVDINEVISASIEKYQRLTDNKNITVVNNIKPYKIKTSKSLFYDLISNIYENAIKYNKIGGSIEFSYMVKENTYFLTIEDTGIGIASADIKRIFERFYVVDKSRKRNQKSTGLGLSIVKHIVNYLDYDIKVESKLGEGTKFIIEIPLEFDRKDTL